MWPWWGHGVHEWQDQMDRWEQLCPTLVVSLLPDTVDFGNPDELWTANTDTGNYWPSDQLPN
jgi:hypothetical protein